MHNIKQPDYYIVPDNPEKYIKTINFFEPTGNVELQGDMNVGSRVLVRKLNATQGIVTISCAGHTFTRAGLSSVTLNSDGDFWLIEKVSSTRWDLIDGSETGSNSNGVYERYANGIQRCRYKATVTDQAISTTYDVLFVDNRTWNFPIAFKDTNELVACVGTAEWGSQATWAITSGVTSTYAAFHILDINSRATGTVFYFRVSAEGRWY